MEFIGCKIEHILIFLIIITVCAMIFLHVHSVITATCAIAIIGKGESDEHDSILKSDEHDSILKSDEHDSILKSDEHDSILKSDEHDSILKSDKISSDDIFIADNEKIIVDGNNMIHQLAGKKIDVMRFEKALKDISEMLTDAFPTQKKHIVLKNPRLKLAKKLSKAKASTRKQMPYFHELRKVSMEFPKITYHLAYGKESNSKNSNSHHLKGRDDFLTIMLATDSYIISKDRFRDFKQFSKIKPFKHYSVTNGKAHPMKKIDPKKDFNKLQPQTIKNHFIFKLISKKDCINDCIKNGSIKLTNKSAFGCVYLVKN